MRVALHEGPVGLERPAAGKARGETSGRVGVFAEHQDA